MWMMPLHLHVNQKSDYDDFLDITMPGYPHKASYFEYRFCHKILVAKIEPELLN